MEEKEVDVETSEKLKRDNKEKKVNRTQPQPAGSQNAGRESVKGKLAALCGSPDRP